MASFRINFQAQTTGAHYIGYRKYDDPAGYTVVTVNVTGTVPQAAYAEIPVPGNLYCAYAGIRYNGYIIAACELLPGEDPATAIPAAATTWSVKLAQQTDPCIDTTILCEATPIATVTLPFGIISCTPDGTYTLDVTEVTPGDEVAAANITITVVAGQPVPGSINIIDPGRYKAVPVVSLPVGVTGCSPAPVFTVTLEDCPTIDLLDYICATHTELSGNTEVTLAVGESISLCTDVTTLPGLPPGYTSEEFGGCHCKSCANVVVTTSGGATGYVDVSYHTCWDNSNPMATGLTLITRRVTAGTTVDLGCVMPDDITLDESNLVGTTILSQTPCV